MRAAALAGGIGEIAKQTVAIADRTQGAAALRAELSAYRTEAHGMQRLSFSAPAWKSVGVGVALRPRV